MLKNKKTEVDVAREVICGHLESLANKDMISYDGLKEAMAIKFDKTNKVLLQHIKALKNIFERAIEQIERENNKNE